jgi:hypothetical protein
MRVKWSHAGEKVGMVPPWDRWLPGMIVPKSGEMS